MAGWETEGNLERQVTAAISELQRLEDFSFEVTPQLGSGLASDELKDLANKMAGYFAGGGRALSDIEQVPKTIQDRNREYFLKLYNLAVAIRKFSSLQDSWAFPSYTANLRSIIRNNPLSKQNAEFLSLLSEALKKHPSDAIFQDLAPALDKFLQGYSKIYNEETFVRNQQGRIRLIPGFANVSAVSLGLSVILLSIMGITINILVINGIAASGSIVFGVFGGLAAAALVVSATSYLLSRYKDTTKYYAPPLMPTEVLPATGGGAPVASPSDAATLAPAYAHAPAPDAGAGAETPPLRKSSP